MSEQSFAKAVDCQQALKLGKVGIMSHAALLQIDGTSFLHVSYNGNFMTSVALLPHSPDVTQEKAKVEMICRPVNLPESFRFTNPKLFVIELQGERYLYSEGNNGGNSLLNMKHGSTPGNSTSAPGRLDGLVPPPK